MVVDTSVAIASLVPSHPQHVPSRAVVVSRQPAIAGHAQIEAYSVLTRLPRGRMPGTDVATSLEALYGRALWPSVADMEGFVARCAVADITGGAVYDALVALAAFQHRATLLTLDRRARSTYRRMNVLAISPDEVIDAP